MYAQNDNTAPAGLRGWWASPPRSGMRRIIAPWEYRHLRAWARVRIATGIGLVGLGAVTLSFGGTDCEDVRVDNGVPGPGSGTVLVRLLGADHRSLPICPNLSLRCSTDLTGAG